MASSIHKFDSEGRLTFNDDGCSFYDHAIIKCRIDYYRKREENIETSSPKCDCPRNSIYGDLMEEVKDGRRYFPECRVIDRIRRCQEQGLFGDNMTVEEKDYVYDCPGLLSYVKEDERSATVHCRIKVI